MSLESVRAERIKKKELLESRGIAPYPSTTNRTNTIAEIYSKFKVLEKNKKEVTLAGRVMVRRGQGQILFVDFKDGTGRFQAVLKQDVIGVDALSFFEEVVDGGDFVEFTGTIFATGKGQESILATQWHMLAKSLLPLPDKHHGLKNEDERFRKRYLDILLNDELKELFKRKEQFWASTRSFLKDKGFLEVETPTLEITTGGAEAKPFKTHHNDFDTDLFLRISVGELWQKRLMAAGFEKTFEIGRVYRNEGTSPEHLQEFSNMEFYWAYADYKDGMRLVHDLYTTLAQEIYGKTKFTYKEHSFDLEDEWIEIDYVSEVEKQVGVNVISATEKVMKDKLSELGVSYEGHNRERLTDTLWKYCRKNISGPGFLVNHPRLIAPLSKSQTDNKDITQMFQPIIAGSEVGRGYSELNDPIDQKKRFEMQKKLLENGDEEAMMTDNEFIEMLEYGIPPTCGFGFGERLFSVFENKSLRETQLFPLMRLRQQ